MVLKYTFCITSTGVLEGIDRVLLCVGITVETKKIMITSNFDAASIMMGKRSGVTARLRDRIGDHNTLCCP